MWLTRRGDLRPGSQITGVFHQGDDDGHRQDGARVTCAPTAALSRRFEQRAARRPRLGQRPGAGARRMPRQRQTYSLMRLVRREAVPAFCVRTIGSSRRRRTARGCRTNGGAPPPLSARRRTGGPGATSAATIGILDRCRCASAAAFDRSASTSPRLLRCFLHGIRLAKPGMGRLDGGRATGRPRRARSNASRCGAPKSCERLLPRAERAGATPHRRGTRAGFDRARRAVFARWGRQPHRRKKRTLTRCSNVDLHNQELLACAAARLRMIDRFLGPPAPTPNAAVMKRSEVRAPRIRRRA